MIILAIGLSKTYGPSSSSQNTTRPTHNNKSAQEDAESYN